MIAFLLVIAAAGLLVAAFVTEMIQYGIASMAAALISMTIIIAGMVMDARTRGEQHASRERDDEVKDETDEDGPAADVPETSLERSRDGEQSQPEADAAPRSNRAIAPQPLQGETDSDAVWVIPGRKRFHKPGCASLAARESQELTREEAAEEGFTPCSRCHSNTQVQVMKRVV